MNLPEDVKNMLLEIGREVEMKVAVPALEETQPDYQEEPLKVDAEFVRKAILNAQEWMHQEYVDNPDYFPHAMYRTKPDVLLGEKATRKRVCTIEDLLKLTGRLKKMEVTPYWGNDHEEILVVRAQIPDAYEARVGFIRVKHIPDRYFKDIKFVDLKTHGKPGKGKISLVLNELEPVWTREALNEIGARTILESYNYVTFKIHKAAHALHSWFPGNEISSGLCESLEEEYVGLEKKSDMALKTIRSYAK